MTFDISQYRTGYSISVGGVVRCGNKALLVRRALNGGPGSGTWALPGGFVDFGELVEQAAVREAKEEVGIDVIPQSILGIYSGDKRDPRGPTVSVVFICKYKGEIIAGDDASSYGWLKLKDIEKSDLAFDHKEIIKDYFIWKLEKGTYWTSK